MGRYVKTECVVRLMLRWMQIFGLANICFFQGALACTSTDSRELPAAASLPQPRAVGQIAGIPGAVTQAAAKSVIAVSDDAKRRRNSVSGSPDTSKRRRLSGGQIAPEPVAPIPGPGPAPGAVSLLDALGTVPAAAGMSDGPAIPLRIETDTGSHPLSLFSPTPAPAPVSLETMASPPSMVEPDYEHPIALVVDDKACNRKKLIRMLKALYHINPYKFSENGKTPFHEASQGELAIVHLSKMARGARYQFIIMDYEMLPGENGAIAAARIRAHEKEWRMAPVPIIGYTASLDDRVRREFEKADVTRFLSKDTGKEELRRILDDSGVRFPGQPA
jgi:CheY-like chemotaxis protein